MSFNFDCSQCLENPPSANVTTRSLLPTSVYHDWTELLESEENHVPCTDDACTTVTCMKLPSDTLVYKGVSLRRGDASSILERERDFMFAASLGTACEYGFHVAGKALEGHVVAYRTRAPLFLVDMLNPANHLALLSAFASEGASVASMLRASFGMDVLSEDVQKHTAWKRASNSAEPDVLFSRWFVSNVIRRFPGVTGWMVLPPRPKEGEYIRWHDELCIAHSSESLLPTDITVRLRHGEADDLDVCINGETKFRVLMSCPGKRCSHGRKLLTRELLTLGSTFFTRGRGHRDDRFEPTTFKQADAFLWTKDHTRLLRAPRVLCNSSASRSSSEPASELDASFMHTL